MAAAFSTPTAQSIYDMVDERQSSLYSLGGSTILGGALR